MEGHIFESVQKCRNVFGDNDFPPTVDKKVLQDKTIIPFWYKQLDLLIQSQLTKMIDVSELKDLTHIDIIVSRDHGRGKFRL